jgi:anti-sigma factor RsiW
LLAGGALPESEQTSVRDHLAHCAQCRQYHDEIARLSAQFQKWASAEPPVEVRPAFHTRWMRSIQTADAPAQTSTRISRWTDLLWPSPAAWGALAAVWVCLLSLQWATSARQPAGQMQAKTRSGRTEVTFAQRQRELSSLLESLASPSAPSTPDVPRPRSQRRVESATI